MQKKISLLIIIALLLSHIFALTACLPELPDDNDEPYIPPQGEDEGEKIFIPSYKDYQRDTVDFDTIVYSRPDLLALCNAFDAVTDKITKNDTSFDEQLSAIEELEDPYNNALTMRSLVTVYSEKNLTSAYWSEENKYISTAFPTLIQSVEDMFVAAAGSDYAKRFEDEYFGPGLIDEYKDGGVYTDNLVALFEREAELESRYSSLSEATVEITYEGVTDTVENILLSYKNKFGEDSFNYLRIYSLCQQMYETAKGEISSDIFVDLVKVRRLIADELSLASYTDYAYDTLYHDYALEDMSDFLDDITEYILPVYIALESVLFAPYFQSEKATDYTYVNIVNTLYNLYGDKNSELKDIYAYMLQHKLYDFGYTASDRSSSSFTTYLNSYNAPFIFATLNGNVTDFSTVAHEFGHFADMFVNYSSETSLDLNEVSSQALELLSVSALKGVIDNKDYRYLEYSEMYSALGVLVWQSFYAGFEERVYALKYEDITLENMNGIVVDIATEYSLNTEYINDISIVMIPHIFLYPHYVQSYSVSIVPSLDILFMEEKVEGEGFEAYMTLIKRESEGLSFEEELARAGIDSPFKDDKLKELANNIYYKYFGVNYFKNLEANEGI